MRGWILSVMDPHPLALFDCAKRHAERGSKFPAVVAGTKRCKIRKRCPASLDTNVASCRRCSSGAGPIKFRWMPRLRHTQTQGFPRSCRSRSFFEPIRDVEWCSVAGHFWMTRIITTSSERAPLLRHSSGEHHHGTGTSVWTRRT